MQMSLATAFTQDIGTAVLVDPPSASFSAQCGVSLSIVLPDDILYAIVDQAGSNAASLRELSLTCSTLRHRARRHLFSGIQIRTMKQMESVREFLDSRPWLPPLVRRVVLSVILYEDHSTPNIWLFDVVPFDLLTRLPNMHDWEMGIIGQTLGPNTVQGRLSPGRLALCCYAKYGTQINRLELSNVFFGNLLDFTGLLTALRNVRGLTCSDIALIQEKSGSGTSWSRSLNQELRIACLHVSDLFITRCIGDLRKQLPSR